ncbi:MAG: hypothetical protein ACRC3G_00655 [Bacteroidales bacterium]
MQRLLSPFTRPCGLDMVSPATKCEQKEKLPIDGGLTLVLMQEPCL